MVAQFAVAGVLLVLSLVGIVGLAVFDDADLVFSFAGWIQAFAIFPGLVVSLVVNALLMRRRGVGRAAKVLLVIEFAVVAVLVALHFVSHSGDELGAAILLWPVVIVLAIVVAIVAAVGGRSPRPGVDELAEDAALDPPTPAP